MVFVVVLAIPVVILSGVASALDAVTPSPNEQTAGATAPAAVADASATRIDDTRQAVAAEAIAGDAPTANGLDCHVLVVDEHGTPVPGCVVHHDDDPRRHERLQTSPPEERHRLANDLELRLQSFGVATTTDASGRTAWRRHPKARSHPSCEVCARLGDAFASIDIAGRRAGQDAEHRLVLRRDTTLSVHCRDHLGAAATGVALRITRHAPDGSRLDELDLPGWFTTGKDGIATLPHLQQLAAPPRDGDTLRVTADVLGADGPWATFSLQQPPREPLQLALPPLGHLTVRLLAADQPLIGDHLLWLGHGEQQRLLWPDVDGLAARRWVALRTTFTVHPVGSELGQQTWQVPGPIEPGTTAHVDLPLADTLCLAKARLLGPDGAPLARVRAMARVIALPTTRPGDSGSAASSPREAEGPPTNDVSANGWPQHDGAVPCRTDALGRGSWRLPLPHATANWALQLEFVPDDGPALGATVPLQAAARVHELGDVTLAPRAAIVRGSFDTGPNPMPYLAWRIEQATGPASWRPRSELAQQHDETGAFAAYGDLPPGRYRIADAGAEATTTPRFAPVEFAPGDVDVRVPIPSESLVASVHLPDDLPWGVLGLLVPLQTNVPLPPIGFFVLDQRVAMAEPETAAQRTLRWQGLPRGRYRLELRLFGVPEPLHVVPELTLPATPGPALAFDLRGRVGAASVQLTNDSAAGCVVFVPQSDRTQPFYHPLAAAAVRFPVPSGGAEVLVVAPGLRPQRLLATPGRHFVTLGAPAERRLEVPALAELPAGISAQLTLQPLRFDGMPQARHQSGGELHGLLQAWSYYDLQRGSTTVPMVTDGTFQILLASPTASTQLPALPMSATDDDAPVRLHVPADLLQKALHELGAATGR